MHNVRRHMKPGVDVITEVIGDGAAVSRHGYYRLRLRIWLSRGGAVVWNHTWNDVASA